MPVLTVLSLLAAGCVNDGDADGRHDSDTLPADPAGDAAPEVVDPAVGTSPPGYAHLPVLRLTMDAPIGHAGMTPGLLEVVTEHDGTLTDLDAAPRVYVGSVAMSIQGASSAGYPKHNYHLELQDAQGGDDDQPLLGLADDSDYVLQGGWSDKTYIRNALAFSLGASLSADYDGWQPGFQFTEVFLDGAYLGIYMLTERVKADGAKIDLPEPAPDAESGDITGGYVFKLDHGRGPCFVTAWGTQIEYLDPNPGELSAAQDAWVQGWFGEFEAMLMGDGYADPEDGYLAWIDPEGFVDHVLVQELAHNVDAYTLSTYPYKDADGDGGLLHGGPLWDFDRAFGNVNYCDCWNTEGWVPDSLASCGAGDFPVKWYTRLLAEPGFQDRLRCRWDALREERLSDSALQALLADLHAPLVEAQPRDEAVWQTIGVNTGVNFYVGETWDDEQSWLVAWVLARAAWMDGALPGRCG
jgi:hypothetical protein